MTREELMDIINRIEQKYPVETWKVGSMDVWPLIKTVLFFEAYKKVENIGLYDKIIRVQRFFGREISSVKNRIKSKVKTDKRQIPEDAMDDNLKEIDLFFSSALTYRADYNDQSISRYFDPLMDKAELLGKEAILFEYTNYGNRNLYKKHRVINGANKYKHFQSVFGKSAVDLDALPQFHQLIKEFPVNSFVLKFKIARAIKQTLIWEMLWTELLQKTKPQIAMGICFYTWAMFGLKIACSKYSIPFIDMQHGGQGILHFSYTFDKKNAQLNLLPDYFWLWDKASAEYLAQWMDEDRLIVGGNPWHDFLTEMVEGTADNHHAAEKKIIVYTLQTGIVIPEFILEAINATYDNFIWYVRFHPRMTAAEKKNINKRLNSAIAAGIVNISDANTIPLPLLLSKAWVHLSAYSGSIAEAALKGVPVNITFDEIGKHSFINLIEDGTCLFYNGRDQLKLWDFIHLKMEGKQMSQHDNKNEKRNILEFAFEKIIKNNG